MRVVFTANNRAQYMRQVLESWSRVRGVEDAHFDFHCEPGCPEMTEACSAAMDFTTVTMHVNQAPLGVQRNPYEALRCGFGSGADFVVLAEDDLLVSSDVLEYFAWARDQYRGDPEVLAVCAFKHHRLPGGLSAVRRTRGFGVWIWGTWDNRWETMIGPDWTFSYEHRGWDHRISDYWAGERGLVVIAPDESRSQHIGQHGGSHMPPSQFAELQSSCFTPDVPPQDYREVI